VAACRGKMHGWKSLQGLAMARREFGELTGYLTVFHKNGAVLTPPLIASTWPHLRCDVALEEGEYQENCLCATVCATVLCTIIMVHKSTSSSYRSVDCIEL